MSSQSIPTKQYAPSVGSASEPRVTLEEYFALERASDVRHEYADGEILAMAGETPTHNTIAGNIYYQLRVAFETRACEAYIENVRTRISATKYRYPDIAALCGEAQSDEERPPSLLNPEVIFEVLSPSTESSDRDEKFMEYGQLETVSDYVLVAQDRVAIIHYARQSSRQWLVTIYDNVTDVLSFPSLEVTLTVADLYRKTALAAAAQV